MAKKETETVLTDEQKAEQEYWAVNNDEAAAIAYHEANAPKEESAPAPEVKAPEVEAPEVA